MNTITSRMSAMAGLGVRGAMLALCLAAVGTVPMLAQDASVPPQQGEMGQPGGRPTPAQMVDHQVQHLTKALSLTPDQVAQVKPILQNQMTKMTALRQDTETPQADKRQQMMQIHTRLADPDPLAADQRSAAEVRRHAGAGEAAHGPAPGWDERRTGRPDTASASTAVAEGCCRTTSYP